MYFFLLVPACSQAHLHTSIWGLGSSGVLWETASACKKIMKQPLSSFSVPSSSILVVLTHIHFVATSMCSSFLSESLSWSRSNFWNLLLVKWLQLNNQFNVRGHVLIASHVTLCKKESIVVLASIWSYLQTSLNIDFKFYVFIPASPVAPSDCFWLN